MTFLRRVKLLPHEWVCGAFLLVMWVRLVCAIGFFERDTLLFLSFLLVNAALLACCAVQQTAFRWRIRLLFYPVAMNSIYPVLRTAIPSVHPKLEDAALQAADRWLIGTNLSLRLEPLVRPAFTEFLSLCYLLYIVYLLFGQAWYFFGDVGLLKKYYLGLFTLYGIGYFGYSILPALGPYLAMSGQFTVPLTGWWFTSVNSHVVLAASNRVDVFPSLHCGNSLYILMFDRYHKPWRFWLYLVPCAGFLISTIYLRYHYFVDIICGIGLSALALWMSNRHQSKGREEA